MNDEFEDSKQYQALLEWEAAAYAELAECEKAMKAKHEYDAAEHRRCEFTLKTQMARARYKGLGGETV